MDGSGAVIRTTTAGSGALGKHTISWDGKDDAGNQLAASVYSVKVTATNSAGTAVTTKVSTNGIVDGVEKDASGNVVLDVGKLQLTTDKILAIHDTYVAPASTANNNSSTSA
jgi:flagellar basal-body rod modification protein FlgD